MKEWKVNRKYFDNIETCIFDIFFPAIRRMRMFMCRRYPQEYPDLFEYPGA